MISPGNLIMSIKAVLISTGVLAVAMLLKISVPLAMDFSVYAAPIIWSSLLLWLKPPYLYVVINGIIITIAASSRFHRSNRDEEEMFAVETTTDMKTQTEQIFHSEKVVEVFADPVVDFGYEMVKDLPTSIDLVESTVEIVREAGDEEKSAVVVVENADSVEDEANETTFSWNLPERTDSSEIATSGYLPAEEKPLVSARFGHRKIPKTTPEGGSRRLKVSKKTKRQETLENTWKMITEGRSMPLTRHMKKSDTWENHGRHIDVDASIFKKSETFRDMTNYQTPSETATESLAKLRKEPSLSQDELNRRVEAFIKKFNEDMRLQREESLRQYKEMIK